MIAGCATVRNEYSLPTQSLSATSYKSETRVVFYNGNGFNPLFLDGSWRVGIKIDGKGVDNLHIGKYVQVFLVPGTYNIELSHFDIFTFSDEYTLQVGAEDMYVRVYNALMSTEYEVQYSEPEEFRGKYEASSKSMQPTSNTTAD